MAQTDIAIASGVKDWERTFPGGADSTGLTIVSANYSDLFSTSSLVFLEFDTSSVYGETITACDLYVYSHQYLKTKAATYQYEMGTCSQNPHSYSNPAANIFYTGTTNPGTGWINHSFDSTSLGHINLFSNSLTFCRLSVQNPGSNRYRTWDVRAYEYVTSPDYAAYLRITYVGAGGTKHQVIIFAQ